MIKLLTLNLWGYNDWNSRISNIVDLINQVDADVIALQEVQRDKSFSKVPQSETLAKLSQYKFHVFIPACKKSSVPKNRRLTDHGLSILSKFELKQVRSLILKKQLPSHEECIAIHTQVKIGEQHHDFCNVHFHNTDTTSLLHLKEVLGYFKEINIEPIILGDFNIYNLNEQRNILNSYSLSTDFKEYVSFTRDSGTLDYIIVPNKHYEIVNVDTSVQYVSDHKAVWASIKTLDKQPHNEA